jgi:glycosyltransferase involved in cell wall biosynthesis
MRIGLFTDMYLPHLSGITNHISLYKRRYEELGHEVFVFTFGDLDYADAEPNVIRSAGIPWGDTGWRFALAFGEEAMRVIPTLDVIHAHHPFQSGRLVEPFCRRLRIPLVFTNHTRYDLYSDAYAGYVPRTVRYAYLQRTLGGFLARCDLVISPAASIAEWLHDFTGYADAEVIPNGIDTRAFSHPASAVSREELGFSADDVVLCYAGRLAAEKNTAYLAQEFALACAQTPRARLLVVGDGPSREDAEEALAAAGVADRARFAGLQPYARIPDFEAAADAFVTGSVSEVHPLVVLEAMAAGLPVVAVDSPGIRETVTDAVTGLLAPDTAPGALAQRITALSTDDALRERLATAAAQHAQAFSLEHTADKVAARYESLLAEKRSRR